MDRLNQLMQPALKILGLDPETGVLWLSTVFFGLAYGGTVVVQEVKGRTYAPGALQRFHISAGINHSIIEEPMLFLPLGIDPLMLWVPRLVVAAVAVYFFRLITALFVRFRRRQPPEKG